MPKSTRDNSLTDLERRRIYFGGPSQSRTRHPACGTWAGSPRTPAVHWHEIRIHSDRIRLERRSALSKKMLRRPLLAFCWLTACAADASWAQEEPAVPQAERPAEPQEDRPTEPFSREILFTRAAELAERPHALPPRPDGDGAARLTYDQYRSIRFDPDAAIWSGQNRTFVVDLLYPGFIYDVPVNINLVVGGTARGVLFKNDLFTKERLTYEPERPAGAGTDYSGFRVRAPLNAADQLDDFLMFQGASYFRAAAKGQLFGLFARGLAVRTARPEGEEYPRFTDFWIERPSEQAERLVIHALLQSPSVVGAYTFTAQPGDETVIDVEVALFPRVDLTAFGIAPLMSMFLFDPSNRVRFDDFRNAVHDSDGLQMVTGRGERLWRPLANPRMSPRGSYFPDESPKGFGLVQRKRAFADYQDTGSHYERRPSLWVEPTTEWGSGHVELFEIPLQREFNNNIVAYWQPAAPLPAGERADFSYRLRFTDEPLDDSLARVVGTRVGESLDTEGQRSFVIDFKGRGDIPDNVVPEVWSSAGDVFAPRGEAVPQAGVYRVTFDLDPQRENLIELRTVLYSGGKPWGETWLYQWTR
jgi:glucans biosynthesis protein